MLSNPGSWKSSGIDALLISSVIVVIVVISVIGLTPELASAEFQRVEAVGIYGIRDAMRSEVIPRDEAIAKARWEGVSRVALELIGESAPSDTIIPDEAPPEPTRRPREQILPSIDFGEAPPIEAADLPDGPSENEVAALQAALGDDVLPYMQRYRILDDRGEVPVLFNDEPDVLVEYVVVVEVIVDVDRVTAALERAGLIVGVSPEEVREAVIVELLGLTRFEALEILLTALREKFGATRVRTIEFSRARQVLIVEGPFGPSALAAKLARFEDPQLLLEPIGVDRFRRRIRLMGRWFPVPAPASEVPARPEPQTDRYPPG